MTRVFYTYTNSFTHQYVKYFWESNKRIYAYVDTSYGPPFGKDTVLLFDFNLTVGDTFYIEYPGKGFRNNTGLPDYIVVTSDDSTGFSGRRELELSYAFNWVEGIGNVYAMAHTLMSCQPPLLSGSYWFECIYADSVPFPCSSFLSSEELSVDNTFSLSPNPVISRLQIQWLQQEGIAQVVIYNIQGRAIKSELLDLNTGHQQMDLSDLKPGMYVIEMRSDKSAVLHRGKVQKH